MKRVILTRGLPASGKSTWAKQFCKDNKNWKRINKDDLRAMLDDGKWSKDNEQFILAARDALITKALDAGYNVIVDDTNLHSKHKNHIWKLVADKATVEMKDFTDVSLEECIKRDQKRAHYVGEKVIRQMYQQYLLPRPVRRSFDVTLPFAIICDIDGTLALFGDANPYERDFMQDDINVSVKDVLTMYSLNKTPIILLSGRESKHRATTLAWLAQNNVKHDFLYMRDTGDNRNDAIVKKEIYEAEIKEKYNVLFVIDDRKRVKRMWVEQGLFVFDVNQYDEEF